MNRPGRVTRAARIDIEEATQWYESRQAGLGRRFVGEVDTAIETISERPKSFPLVHRDLRRAMLKHFPYGVFFREDSEELIVVAVIDLRRDPRSWQRR